MYVGKPLLNADALLDYLTPGRTITFRLKKRPRAVRGLLLDVPNRIYAPPAPANLRDWKHSRQKTGRPCVGRNGTVVSLPHAEQFVVVSTRSRATAAPPDGREARFALHDLQRFGSFLKFLSAKKSCSPAVQMNSVPQSTQVRDLSWNSIDPTSHEPARARWREPKPPGRDRTASPKRLGYSTSRRCFFLVRLRASACFARRRSP